MPRKRKQSPPATGNAAITALDSFWDWISKQHLKDMSDDDLKHVVGKLEQMQQDVLDLIKIP